MSKLITFFFALLATTAVSSDPIVFICERPAWEGVEGCGPNNTYFTYAFHVESDDLKLNKDDPGYKMPRYAFQMRKGCDIYKARRSSYGYSVSEDALTFWIKLVNATPATSMSFSRVKINRSDLTAVMDGVDKNPYLSCRKEASEDWIIAHAKGRGGPKTPPAPYMREFPPEPEVP